jgi:Tol biopolymer transport system component
MILLPGRTVMISLGTNSLFDPEISADGRYVTYTRRIQITSFNYHDDIFRHDLVTKANMLVNRNSSGGPSSGNASAHSMSSDGRYVAFESTATDLDPPDFSTDSDIYVHDFVLGSKYSDFLQRPRRLVRAEVCAGRPAFVFLEPS